MYNEEKNKMEESSILSLWIKILPVHMKLHHDRIALQQPHSLRKRQRVDSATEQSLPFITEGSYDRFPSLAGNMVVQWTKKSPIKMWEECRGSVLGKVCGEREGILTLPPSSDQVGPRLTQTGFYVTAATTTTRLSKEYSISSQLWFYALCNVKVEIYVYVYPSIEIQKYMEWLD